MHFERGGMWMDKIATLESELDNFYDELKNYCESGDIQKIEEYLSNCELHLSKTMRGRGILISIYNEEGFFYRSIGQYQKSIVAFEKARQEIIFRFGEDCTEYATLLNNMAGTYRMDGQRNKAIQYFLEAIKVYEKIGEGQTYPYASVQNNLALAYKQNNQTKEAIFHLEKALNLILKMPEHQSEMVAIYSNLTTLYSQLEDETTAKKYLDLALQIFEECKEEENIHYAAALNSLGGFLYGIGEDRKAIEVYQKAEQYTKLFFGENIEYGIACQNMYWVYRRMGKFKEAAQVLKKAEQVYEIMFGKGHQRTKIVKDELERITEKNQLKRKIKKNFKK